MFTQHGRMAKYPWAALKHDCLPQVSLDKSLCGGWEASRISGAARPVRPGFFALACHHEKSASLPVVGSVQDSRWPPRFFLLASARILGETLGAGFSCLVVFSTLERVASGGLIQLVIMRSLLFRLD
jgi:hypothetical protein